MRTDSSEMTDVESVISNFAASARAGRRNALPDIQSSVAAGGSSDLPLKLGALSVKEGNASKPLKHVSPSMSLFNLFLWCSFLTGYEWSLCFLTKSSQVLKLSGFLCLPETMQFHLLVLRGNIDTGVLSVGHVLEF